MTTLVADVQRSPLMAGVFFLSLVLTLGYVMDRLGIFGPGDPLVIASITTTVDGDQVSYVVEGTKLTDRNLIAQTVSWVLSDGSIVPVPITRDAQAIEAAANGEQRRLQGERFVSSTLTVILPPVARSDPGSRLRWCWAYESLPTFCVDRPLVEILATP